MNEQIIKTQNGRIIKAWTKGVEFEDQAKAQVESVLSLPFVEKHVAVMPDVHAGKGCTVGSVIATKGAVVPSFVGVDLGCGMRASRLSLVRSDCAGKEDDLFKELIRLIPAGRTDNGGKGDRGRWTNPPDRVSVAWGAELASEYEAIIKIVPAILGGKGDRPTLVHLGTLGTGNHYVELASDEEGRVWIILHSGSRGIGARIGSVFMEKAKELCEKWFVPLASPDLAYLPQEADEYHHYLLALKWAQKFAFINRRLMMEAAKEAVSNILGAEIKSELDFDCHHNFAQMESHFGQNLLITRKGAVRARPDDWVLIPGSMGARSYVGKGLGNPDSFMSCSHGAGRRMSRGEARRTITLDEHIAATEGVVCYKDSEVIDESPAAYKDIDAVIEAENDLFAPQYILKQFVNMKGKEQSRR